MPIASRLTSTGTLLVNGTFDEATFNSVNPIIINQFTYSEDFSNVAWQKSGATITSDQAIAPNGTYTADLMSATGLYPRIIRPAAYNVTNGQSFTHTIFVKYINQQYCNMVQEVWPGSWSSRFDLINGTYTQSANVTASMSSVGNGWYRCRTTYVVPTGQTSFQPQFRIGSYDGTNYAGSNVYVWGAQLEGGTSATIYQGIAAANTLVTPLWSTKTVVDTVFSTGNLDEVSLPTGAISFNGTNQYLSVNNGADTTLAIGTGDFTWEAWVYPTSFTADRLIYDGRDGLQNSLNIRLTSTTGVFRLSYNLANLAFEGTAVLANNWTHLAISRSGTSLKLFQNGIVANTSTDSTSLTNGTNRPIVGAAGYAIVGNNPFAGYISNLRLIKGLAVYTANFTPPQAILPATAGADASLLLNVIDSANFIRDNGPNKFTLTNNGTATFIANGPFNQGSTVTAQRQLPDGTLEVYNQFDEFTGAPVVDTSLMVWVDAGQTSSYPGSGATWTDLSGNGKNYTLTNTPTYNSILGGGVITFAGASSQYATTATTLFNSTTFNTYTMNLWVYPTGAGNFVQVDGQTTPNTGYHYSAIEISAAGVIKFGQWIGSMSTIATSTQSLNAWYNLVITYNGTTATAYINGVSVGSTNIIWSSPGANTFMALMAIDTTNMGTGAYASGSLGAFMVYRRALSADEIATNFNALRGRYGI